MRPQHPVRRPGDLDDLAVRDEIGHPARGGLHRQEPVGVAVHDERRDVDLPQVVAEVGDPRGRARRGSDRRGRRADVPAVAHDLLGDAVPERLVEVVEVAVELSQVREAVGLDARHRAGDVAALEDSLRVVVGVEQERRDGTEEHRLADVG
jgi:hypothetical protein